MCQIFLCGVLIGFKAKLFLQSFIKMVSGLSLLELFALLCHLLKAPRLTEFASLVSLLTDSDKSGEQILTGSAQVGKF